MSAECLRLIEIPHGFAPVQQGFNLLQRRCSTEGLCSVKHRYSVWSTWNTLSNYAEMKTGLLCPLFGCWPNPQGESRISVSSCVLHRTPKLPKLPKLIISTAVGGQVPGCSIASQRPRKGELFMKQLGTTNWN